jgi:nicotinamidase-related amidase
MNILNFPHWRKVRGVPITAFVDLQVEYVADGRAYCVKETDAMLAKCKEVLEYCRKEGLPIAHFRQLKSSAYFNKSSEFSSWIDGFQPKTNEMVFERRMPSCYSNIDYLNLLSTIDNPTTIFLGFSGESSFLSTSVHAHHQSHDVIFVSDASASRLLGNLSESEAHKANFELISLYGDTASAGEVISYLSEVVPE